MPSQKREVISVCVRNLLCLFSEIRELIKRLAREHHGDILVYPFMNGYIFCEVYIAL